MKKTIERFLVASTLFLASISIAYACTDIRVVAQDGTVIIGRTLEFAELAHSNLLTSPQQKAFQSTAPNGKAGMAWQAKYGYLFLDSFNTGIAMDGMNEAGLSVEILYLPGEAEYQIVPEGQESQALPYFNLGDWILGNFQSVEEVRKALPKIYVYAATMPQTQDFIFPVHYAIHDASGKSIVVEYVKGELNIYDNDMGVMTNSPTYDWHLTNLRNYINLSPTTPKPIVDNGRTFAATGQGAGMVGLPGDISPPSRFVKMAVMLKTILQPKNATAALNVTQHVINNVDIPLGFVRETQNANTATNEFTQWTVFKDLTHKKLYYRTYENLTLQAIDLNKIDFSAKAPPLKMSIAAEQYTIDKTTQFMRAN